MSAVFTPRTDFVRAGYVSWRREDPPEVTEAEFDGWLDQVRREAASAALAEQVGGDDR